MEDVNFDLMKKSKTKYDLYPVQYKNNAPDARLRPVGFALQYEGESHYVVKVWLFPRNTYFLTKNRDSQTDYMLFSKVIRGENGQCRFQNPVGIARLDNDSKTKLKIYLDLLGAPIEMSLFPSE